jgi:antitoxin ChpS
MHTTNLRKVGGSIMLAVPPALLDVLHLSAGSIVGIDVEGDSLVIRSSRRPRYTLDDLLSRCKADSLVSEEDRKWIDLPPAGDEL